MSGADRPALQPPARIAFVGLGQMGLPIARRLAAVGFTVIGSDRSPAACRAFQAAGGAALPTAAAAAAGATALITMLPDGAVVREVLLGPGAAASVLPPDALVIDMSSSAPLGTRALGAELAALGLRLVDAPVSGGVRRAQDGTLAIMAGGEAADIEQARSLFQALGAHLFMTGPLGSGHAMKALNNYVSAAGMVAAMEAVLVGEAFGLKGATMVDILNVSTGRNTATELKMKQFVLSGTFASGFSLALMAKDLRTAAELAEQLGLTTEGVARMASLWAAARAGADEAADHTAIFSYLLDHSCGSGQRGCG